MQNDSQKILEYFRRNPNKEINAYLDIVTNGLRILEYSGRISGARDIIDCHCAKGDPIDCTSTEHILNTKKGYYKYITNMTPPKVEPKQFRVSNSDLETRLENLRVEYRSASETKRKLLEISARRIKEMIAENNSINNLTESVQKELL